MRPFSGLDAESVGLLGDAVPSLFFVTSAAPGSGEVPWPRDSVHPEDEPRLIAAWEHAYTTGEPMRCRVRLNQGQGVVARYEIRAVPLRTVEGVGVVWLANKVTTHQDSLTRSPLVAELLRAICKTASDLVYAKDAEGRYLYANPTCARVLGAGDEEVPGTTDERWLDRATVDELRDAEREALTREGTLPTEHALPTPGGVRRYAFVRAPFLDEGGQIAGVVGIGRDVTDLHRELSAVREERDMFATIAAIVPGAFASYRLRPDGVFEMPFATLSVVDLFGASPDELERDPDIPRRLTHPDDRATVEAALIESATHGVPFRCEYRVQHPQRGEIWVEVASGPTKEADGSTLWHGFLLDVTWRNEVERELRDKTTLLEGIAQSSPGAIFTLRRGTDGSLGFLYASAAMGDIYGVPVGELVREFRLARGLVHPDDRRLVRRTLARSALKLEAWRCEYRVVHPERGVVWVEGQAMPTRGVDGATSWNGVLLDVTQRKRAEEAVRIERDRFTALSETVPGTIYSYRLGARGIEFLYLSRRIQELCGLTPAEVKAKPRRMFELMDAADIARIKASFLDGRESLAPRREEFRIHHPTRGETWVEGRSQGVRGADGGLVWHGILLDLTERRRSEAKLRASESTLRAVVETVPDILMLIGRDGAVQFVNRLLPGQEMSDVVSKPARELIAPAMRDGVTRTMNLVFASGEVQSYEAAVISPDDGSGDGQRWFNTRVGPVVQDGEVVALTLASTDITERKQAENALRASETRYRSLVELLPDAVFIHSGGKITFCNNAFVRLMNASERVQLIGLTPFDVVHPEHHELLRERLARLVQDRQVLPAVEVSVRTLDGGQRPVTALAAAIVDGGEPGVLVVMHDLTDRKKLEEQFRQAHKMEAFGQLAGGVAHDFNNLLTVILSESALLLGTAPPGSPLAASLGEVQKAGERAAGLTRQLLAFSRRTVLEPKVLDLNVAVREMENLLQRLIGEDIRVATSLAPSLRRVHVDPSQLAQVLMNLAVNARDAMPRGGRLEISTANVALEETAAQGLGLAPGHFVRLSVRDDGTGMEPDVRARIFQPFFTTKPVGEGTGLGLAVVHGIVTQSGGAIDVHTEVGRGTSFEILLPASRSASSPSIAAASAAPPLAKGTVLVVEDDDAVRRLAKRVLTAAGYTVLLARHGVEALSLLEAGDTVVDLVVTDVVMPQMGGRELGERLRASQPHVKLLYVSGYTNDALVRRGLQSEEVDFLPKPYTPSLLSAAVARALERS